MHLYVNVGSLVETQPQQGIAHLLEHMQFDGSTRFQPDELVKYFQRIGMQFGPDANAHTGFSNTVYDILLPRGDKESLAEAMLVLHEYAQGALLLPDQIEKEKKVVLAEKRSRDSADYRVFKRTFAFELPGSLIAQRFPIGLEETIDKFDRAMVKQFYDTWYRPENMVLVMVGQFDPDEARRLAEDQFSGLRPRAAAVARQSLGSFIHRGLETFYYHDDEISTTTVRIETVEQRKQPADSAEYQHESMIEAIANQMVQERLSRLVQQENAPMTSADIGTGYFLQTVRFNGISAECEPRNWKNTLNAIEQVLRRALLYGFTPGELERAKKDQLAQLQQAREKENTQDSTRVAMALIQDLSTNRVSTSAGQQYDLFYPFVENLSVEAVNRYFKQSWSAPHRLVLVTGNVDLSGASASPEEMIQGAYRQSEQAPVQPPQKTAAHVFPYLPDPARTSTIARTQTIGALGIEQTWYDNGLLLSVKPTTFKKGDVVVALTFGSGSVAEPGNKPGLVYLTEAMLNEAGFGKMDRADLTEALAGRLADIQLDIREDLILLKGNASSKELPLLLQLLRAFILDAGYRPETLELVRKRLIQEATGAEHEVQGMMQHEGMRFLSGGDRRFGLPTAEQLRQITLEDIKTWFQGQIDGSTMELAVVGDVDPEQVKKLVSTHLSDLPQFSPDRNAEGKHPDTTIVFPAGKHLVLKADSKIPNALVMVAFPTEDMWDIGRTRRLALLSEIFSEKLRVHVREKLGAAYSPFAYNHPHRAYPGYGVFLTFVEVAPDKAQTVVSAVKQIADELHKGHITPDEFRRALDPTLTQIKDLRQSNNYWLNSVLAASGRYPQQIQWAQTMEKDYAAITMEDVERVAKRYMNNQRAATVIILPEGGRRMNHRPQ